MHYFAYGSNLHHGNMARRCPSSVFLGPASLRNYKLAFRYPSTSWPGGGAADIIQNDGSITWGALWKTTESDLLALDRYEDVAMGGYRRISIEVNMQGELFCAWSYEVCNKLSADLRPVPGYIKLLLTGAEDCQLPASYRAQLEKLFSSGS